MAALHILESMILSASGWRGVFAASGDEESAESGISADRAIMVRAAARVFAEYLAARGGGQPAVLVGRDTRPTGKVIADHLIRAFIALDCRVRYVGITAAPEIMARARDFAPDAGAGFVFISASHNPIGHNGLKFGLTGGGVLPGTEAALLAARLREILAGAESAVPAQEPDGEAIARVYAEESAEKERALHAYGHFALETAGGADSAVITAIRAALAEQPLGVAADLNGSARTRSIDEPFITALGARYRAINTEPGAIAHRIVPEGESLEPCREFLETLHRGDGAFVLGYVPDCDGDRGNLVIWDDHARRARTLEAQEVFALACVSELAHLVWTGELTYDEAGRPRQKVAVAVNDPTSLRVDAIAEAFGAALFRAEVGEANVVSRARELREAGYIVRILGEGSAGGNITHPSAVRDPLNTVMALLKLLAVRNGAQDGAGFFDIWRRRAGIAAPHRAGFTLADIIASLPPYVSTGAYTDDAILRVKTTQHGALKDRYQAIFLREWETRRADLAACGITSWEAAAYQGTKETRPLERFGDAGRGGLRIVFRNGAGKPAACIWMRGSGTEPVFRVMADAAGPDSRLERDLIAWQRRMVMEADAAGRN
ncbi:MAG: phosphatidylglycerol lysyltransferase [Spirochaetaceae bacterium]|jgi:phosphoglucomutase|nr:phosphatidylglycerol lysyltransferase [Spirochaetaceae bacterium]